MTTLLGLALMGLICVQSAHQVGAQGVKGAKTAKPAKGELVKEERGEALRLRFNPFRLHVLSIEAVQPGNSLLLRESAWGHTERGLTGFKGKWADVSEGVYVGLSPAPEFAESSAVCDDEAALAAIEEALRGKHLFRAEVKAIRTDGGVVISVAASAAQKLKAKDRIVLFRPPGTSTAQLKTAPEWLKFPEKVAAGAKKGNAGQSDAPQMPCVPVLVISAGKGKSQKVNLESEPVEVEQLSAVVRRRSVPVGGITPSFSVQVISRPVVDQPKSIRRLRYNPFRLHICRVMSVEKDQLLLAEGTLTKAGGGMQQLAGDWGDLAEGHYLGLTPFRDTNNMMDLAEDSSMVWGHRARFGPGRFLFRCEVLSIESSQFVVARLKVGAGVAARFERGEFVTLFRPLGASTEDIQQSPDWIEFAEGYSRPEITPQGTTLFGNSTIPTEAAKSQANLKTIGEALSDYHESFGEFPPAVMFGPDGKPWHSWRVLLLRYLEGGFSLLDTYDLNEPWDGPNNLKLIPKMPAVYGDPIHGPNPNFYAHYAAISGDKTAFPTPRSKWQSRTMGSFLAEDMSQIGRGVTRFHYFNDGLVNTLLIGSVGPDRKIPWTKPEDVVYGDSLPKIGEPQGFAAPFGKGEEAVGLFLRGDMQVRALPRKTPLPTLHRLATISGDDAFDLFHAPPLPTPEQPLRFPCPIFVFGSFGQNVSKVWIEYETLEFAKFQKAK